MNYRYVVAAHLCCVVLALTACASLIPTPEPQDPDEYLNNALNWIQSHAVYGDKLNWEVIRRQALSFANNSKETSDTYAAIRYVLDRLRDGFASLDLPQEDRPGTNMGMWAIEPQNVVIQVDPNGPADRAGIKVGDVIELINDSHPRPSSPYSAFSDLNFGTNAEVHITLRRAGQSQLIEVVVDQMSETPGFDVQPTGRKLGADPNGIGYIELPGYGGYPYTYPGFGHEVLRKLDRTELCGWIIDIRRTGGGDIWSYLAAIGPIMGEGDVGGFAYLDGTHDVWSYKDGKVIWAGNERDESLVQSGIYHPKRATPPVALLISRATSAAGELVIVAFEGRGKVRTFGETTRGLPTLSIHTPLSDGAHIFLSGAFATDRNGKIYDGPIPPDEPVTIDWSQFGADQDPVILAAFNWLSTQPDCKN